MTSESTRQRRRFWPLAVLCAVVAVAWGTTPLSADVAAGVTIRNVATYEALDGLGRPRTRNAEALVGVNLVACTPSIDAPPDQTTVYTGPASTHRYRYTVTACANGPDDYSIDGTITSQSGNAADGSIAVVPPLVTLGASVTIDGSSTTTLLCPGDGSADARLAGFEIGDVVTVDGERRTIAAILEPESGPSSIVLDAPLALAPTAGVRVLEQATVFVEVTAGTGDGSDVTIELDTTAIGSAGASTDSLRSTFLDDTARTPATIELLRYAGNASSTPGLPLDVAACSDGGAAAGPFTPLPDPTLLGGAPFALPDVVGTFDATVLKSGEPLLIRVTDADQNLDPAVVETIDMTLSVDGGLERELLRLSETTPASGEFAGAIQLGSGAVIPFDCRLQLAVGDMLNASYVDPADGSDTATDAALVDPAGRVFDDATGMLVDGASVTLIDTVSGNPATVLGDDGVSAFPASIVSGGTAIDAAGTSYPFARGTFRFPVVPPGTYRLQIDPPAGYGFPSSETDVALQALPGAPFEIVTGSRGEPFVVGPAPLALVDVPLTALVDEPFVTKSAERATVGVGDLLAYSVVVQNPGAADNPAVTLDDRLPLGFRYRSGSARLDGARVADPAIDGGGRGLRFELGALAAGASVTLRYVVEVAAGTPSGPATNLADAGGNVSRATVIVRDDLRRDRSILTGRVVAGTCDDERGVAGVRVLLEDGTFVDSDADGRWHIEGLTPGLHVVQLDLDSLPDGYEVAEPCRTNSRFAGRAWSRFVELRPGTLWRTDFRLRERPQAATSRTFTAREISTPRGLLSPADGERIVRSTVTVRARLDDELTPRLLVDDVPLDAGRLGLQIRNEDDDTTLYGWIGVELGGPGTHRLLLQGLDDDGTVRVEHVASVERTGRVHSIRVVDTAGNVADGRTPLAARVELLDVSGTPIPASLALEIVGGELRPWTPEHERTRLVDAGVSRAATVDDRGVIRFAPVERSGRYTVELRHETLVRRLTIDVAPADRDWVVVGFAEGTLAHRSLEGSMERLAADDPGAHGDDLEADGEIALYATGRVRGGWLLTLAYDSAGRDTGADGLEQTIDPGSYYTVYGDASEQRYGAPSRERLYVRLERSQFAALFGDFRTGLTAGELTRYDRGLTGGLARYDGAHVSFVLFGSETADRFARDELRGNGTSGPYRLSRRSIVINSERVTIETRDRFRSERIVEATALTRHLDYDIDYESGQLMFKRPVASRSELLDPVFVVVDYESNDGGGEALSVGGRVALHDETGRFELGVTAVDEGRDGADDGELYGVDLRLEPSPGTVLRAETAHSQGRAWLADLAHTTGRVAARAYVREQDGDFGLGQQNGSESGTRKAGLDLRLEAGERLAASGEAFRQENLDTGAVREVVSAQVELRREAWDLRGGGRHAVDEAGDGSRFRSSLLTGGGRYRIDDRDLLLRADVELGLDDRNESADYPNRVVLGTDWRLLPALTLFGEQEFTGGGGRSSTTRAGIKSEPWRGGRLHGAVENAGTTDAVRTFAVLGLQQSWRLGERWAIDASLDRVTTVRSTTAPALDVDVPPASGTRLDDSSALSFGASYRREQWSWSARAEHRDGDRERRSSLFSGVYRELGQGSALATRAELWRVRTADGTSEEAARVRLDAVRRPPGKRWTLLDRLELKLDDRTALSQRSRVRALIHNLDANVLFNHGRSQLALQHGVKLVEQTIDGDTFGATTWLAGAEWRHDLTERWDVGAHGHVLFSVASDTTVRSYGVSLGRSLGTNLWLGVGYNLEGFRDDDFAAADATAEGPLLRFRFKFDQESLRALVRSGGR